MSKIIGQNGHLDAWDDFLQFDSSSMLTTAAPLGHGGWNYCCVNEGSFNNTVDEPGGIKAVTNDTGDSDNCFVFTGPFVPADGGAYMEVRLKLATVSGCASFIGFSETLAADTPVCPAEISTSTVAYNGSGGMVGLAYDADMATADWMAVFGDAGAATGTATNAGATITNDQWYLVRVSIGPSGRADVYLDGQLVSSTTSVITTTDKFYACFGVENRGDYAQTWEVDYAWAKSFRDWNVT